MSISPDRRVPVDHYRYGGKSWQDLRAAREAGQPEKPDHTGYNGAFDHSTKLGPQDLAAGLNLIDTSKPSRHKPQK